MIIQKKTGNIGSIDISKKQIDKVQLEWFESGKRILHKKTNAGIALSLKFLNENQQLTEGDILFEDTDTLIVVEIKPCDAIVVNPKSMEEMASICYEIGNKHLPLFYYNDELLIAFEKPLYNLLMSSGYDVKQAQRKLLHPLKTTVSPHGTSGETLFSKIMKLTGSE
ncbi:urease accessory protein UreE [Ferruginibacter sp. HRS2-29]|uniref:urease accessory protein UreE n=1 Tax=Ferruginibacter sp. HRS2-29 TaxID=2487334 RepID=UPI0020CCD3A8|nr:urease accessory protein UreE [Ferruginibacter sp. HRS2-29]MCP9753065.1 urease accessory protein UreE [Ferruginibacter sp. HRS2-29]